MKKNQIPDTRHKLKGQILVLMAVYLTVVLITVAAFFSRTSNFLSFSSRSTLNEQATHVAEAGIDHAIWQLNEDEFFHGADEAFGTVGTFSTLVSGSGNSRNITSIGYVPDLTNYKAKRKIKAEATTSNSVSIAFPWAVQVGADGLNMSADSKIIGDVFSNANIEGGGDPIITGDAWATGSIDPQTDLDVQGDRHPGQWPPSVMPTIDYQYWRDAAFNNGGEIDCSLLPAECDISGVKNIGPKKYYGDLTLRGSGALVTLDGPLWVDGNFEISNNAQLNLNDSFGSQGTVIIVDGQIQITNDGRINPTTAPIKGYILLVSTHNGSDAINIENDGASAIFYALDGETELSSDSTVPAVIAKYLNMSANSIVDYDSNLAGAGFSSGSGGAWIVKKGTYHQTNSP